MADTELSILIKAIDKASAEISSIKKEIKELGDEADKSSGKTGGLGGSLTTLGKTAAIAATAGIAAVAVGLGSAVNAAANFEHAVDQVGAVANATDSEMKKLSDAALRIGRDTAFSATEAAGAMEMLAANGLTVTQIINGAADATVALAAAGGVDLATAADTASTSMALWNIEAEKMDNVVNRLAGAANVSRFGVEDMSQAIAMGGAAAKVAGITFDDFTTAIAATANNFASGSDAGTSFKTFLLQLNPTADKAKDVMKELGIITAEGSNRFFDAQGNVKSMADIIEVLNETMGDLTAEEKVNKLKQMFGTDAFRAAAGLLDLTREEFEALSKTMGETDAAEVAAKRMGNFKGAMEQLKGSLEVIQIEVGMKLIPVLSKAALFLAEYLPKAMDATEEALRSGARAAEPYAKAAAEIGKAFLEKIKPGVDWFLSNKEAQKAALAGLLGVVTLLAVATAAWAASMVIALAPILALIAAAALLGAGIYLLVQHWDELTAKYPAIEEGINRIKDVFKGVADWFQAELLPAFQQIFDRIPVIIDGVRDAIQRHWEDITDVFQTAFDLVMSITETWVDAFKNLVEIWVDVIRIIIDILSGDWADAWEGTKELFMDVLTFWKDLFTDAKDVIGDALNLMVEAVDLAIELIVDVLSNAKDVILEGVGNVAEWLVDMGKEMIDGLISGITEKIPEGISALWNFKDELLSGIGNAVDWFIGLGEDLVRGIIEGIKRMGPAAIDAITGLGGDMVEKGKSFFHINSPSLVFMEIGEGLVEGLALGITDNGGMAIDAITAVGTDVSEAFQDQLAKSSQSDKEAFSQYIAAIFQDAVSSEDHMGDYLNDWLGNMSEDFREAALELGTFYAEALAEQFQPDGPVAVATEKSMDDWITMLNLSLQEKIPLPVATIHEMLDSVADTIADAPLDEKAREKAYETLKAFADEFEKSGNLPNKKFENFLDGLVDKTKDGMDELKYETTAAVRDWFKKFVTTLNDGRPDTEESLQKLFAGLVKKIEDSPLPAEAQTAAQAVIKQFRDSIASGKPLAEADLKALMDALLKIIVDGTGDLADAAAAAGSAATPAVGGAAPPPPPPNNFYDANPGQTGSAADVNSYDYGGANSPGSQLTDPFGITFDEQFANVLKAAYHNTVMDTYSVSVGGKGYQSMHLNALYQSLLKDFPSGDIPGFFAGSLRIPRDMFAFLHEGEQVVRRGESAGSDRMQKMFEDLMKRLSRGGGIQVVNNGPVYASNALEAERSLSNVGYGLKTSLGSRGVVI